MLPAVARSRFRLRYEGTDLELVAGEFTVGRSSACSLALDDGLVSRQHAVFLVGDGGVSVRDLGSRNGVSVNGKKIAGDTRLRHMDRVRIGGVEFVLLERQSASPAQTLQIERCLKCGALNDPSVTNCASCGNPVNQPTTTRARPTLAGDAAPMKDARSFLLVAPIAEKGLSLKRYEEAHRLLQQPLDVLRQAILGGEKIKQDVVDRGLALALQLIESDHTHIWVTWVFEVLTVRGTMLSADAVERLHERARATRYADPKPLRRYLDRLRMMDLSPADRFTLRRLEALERVISA